MEVTEEVSAAPQLTEQGTGLAGGQRFTAPGERARISVLVVNFNTRERVEWCLEALRRAPVAGGLQVVVVDNASADGSAEALRERFPDVELIANPENRGYATANNQASARATAPYLLLLNPDAAVEPETPERMAAFLDSHTPAAAVTGKLVAADGSSCAYLYDFPSALTLLLKETALSRLFPAARDRRVAAYEMRGRVPDAVAPVPQPPGACLMVRRSALDGALFDERFPLYFNDVDLCRRLHRRGEIYFLPDARVFHERGEGGLNRAPETAMLEHAVSAVRYFRKHEGFLAATILYLGLALEFTAKATYGSLPQWGRLSSLPGPTGQAFQPAPLRQARAPFRGTPRQNFARLARFLLDISYFDRRSQGGRSPWRRFVLRTLEADLWSG